MYDLRKIKKFLLDSAKCLKDETTYQFNDETTGKKLIAKLISQYDDSEDIYLLSEFKKLILPSSRERHARAFNKKIMN